MLLPTAQFRHVTLTARRSRLVLTLVVEPSFYLDPLTSYLPVFLGHPLWTATSGGVNPRAMGTAGTSRYTTSLTLSDAKDRVTTDSEKNKLG
jgi:hypothetical protein